DILHGAVERAAPGRSIAIEAHYRGPSGVFNPILHFRRIGSAEFTALTMAELPADAATPPAPEPGAIIGKGGTGRFVAEIPSAFATGDVEYYLEAMDQQGNGPSFDGSREHPHVVRVMEELVPPPTPDLPVDPDAALAACRETRELTSADSAKLGPCRKVEGFA